MKLIFKKISEMSNREEDRLSTFFMYVCDMPINLLVPNYSGNETACIFFEGNNFAEGEIMGALLYREEKPSTKEIDKFSIKTMFSIVRVDTPPKMRHRGIGQRLLQETVEHLISENKPPFLIRIESILFGGIPEKFGFEEFGRYFLYKVVR